MTRSILIKQSFALFKSYLSGDGEGICPLSGDDFSSHIPGCQSRFASCQWAIDIGFKPNDWSVWNCTSSTSRTNPPDTCRFAGLCPLFVCAGGWLVLPHGWNPHCSSKETSTNSSLPLSQEEQWAIALQTGSSFVPRTSDFRKDHVANRSSWSTMPSAILVGPGSWVGWQAYPADAADRLLLWSFGKLLVSQKKICTNVPLIVQTTKCINVLLIVPQDLFVLYMNMRGSFKH